MSPGQTIGEWLVLSEAPRRGKHRYWRCRCSCGVEREVKGSTIATGQSRSCGHTRVLRHDSTMAAAFAGRLGGLTA